MKIQKIKSRGVTIGIITSRNVDGKILFGWSKLCESDRLAIEAENQKNKQEWKQRLSVELDKVGPESKQETISRFKATNPLTLQPLFDKEQAVNIAIQRESDKVDLTKVPSIIAKTMRRFMKNELGKHAMKQLMP